MARTGDYEHTPMVTLEAYHDRIATLEARVEALEGVLRLLLLYLDTVEEWDEDGEIWAGIEPPDRQVTVRRADVVDALADTPEQAMGGITGSPEEKA